MSDSITIIIILIVLKMFKIIIHAICLQIFRAVQQRKKSFVAIFLQHDEPHHHHRQYKFYCSSHCLEIAVYAKTEETSAIVTHLPTFQACGCLK